jgi:hypothetical protein
MQTPENALLHALESATQELLYISETDASLVPFFWPGEAPLTPEVVKEKAALHAEAPLEEQTIDEFFEPVTTVEEWMNDEEKAEAARFGALRELLEAKLQNLQVFRAGETKLRVFFVGETEGGYAGVETEVVET